MKQKKENLIRVKGLKKLEQNEMNETRGGFPCSYRDDSSYISCGSFSSNMLQFESFQSLRVDWV